MTAAYLSLALKIDILDDYHDRQYKILPKCVPPNPLNLIPYMANGTCQRRLGEGRTLSWRDHPGLSGVSNLIEWVLKSGDPFPAVLRGRMW